MALHNRRRRLALLAERESEGDVFWSESFSERARVRLSHAFDSADAECSYQASSTAHQLILEDEGLRGLGFYDDPSRDLHAYLDACPDEMVPTVIEAMYQAVDIKGRPGQWGGSPARSLAASVAEILVEERIAYELDDGEMVSFSSKAMHVDVVEPALRLIGGADWAKVDEAYRSALAEISGGDAGDAITDAATALQEALKLLGATGGSLGPLVKSARKIGLLAPHDLAFEDIVSRTIDWVSADRSEVGDAHTVTAALKEDAWLTIHIVGALIVRLSSRTQRPKK
jgi:hypothetical protein